MKNTHKLIALTLALGIVSSPAFAATASSGPVTVSAQVDGTLTLSVALKKNSTTGATVTSMDFGTLKELPSVPGTLRSSTTGSTGTGSVVAMISANSHGLPYQIKQTGLALSNGTTTLPSGACTVVPVYAAADNGGAAQPAGSSLGTKASWVATDKLLYSSDPAGQLRIIQAIYSITDDPAAGATAAVPISQAGGTYNGTVTFTVTA